MTARNEGIPGGYDTSVTLDAQGIRRGRSVVPSCDARLLEVQANKKRFKMELGGFGGAGLRRVGSAPVRSQLVRLDVVFRLEGVHSCGVKGFDSEYGYSGARQMIDARCPVGSRRVVIKEARHEVAAGGWTAPRRCGDAGMMRRGWKTSPSAGPSTGRAGSQGTLLWMGRLSHSASTDRSRRERGAKGGTRGCIW